MSGSVQARFEIDGREPLFGLDANLAGGVILHALSTLLGDSLTDAERAGVVSIGDGMLANYLHAVGVNR